MDRLDAMRVFARIVERRSFSRAAEDLALPRSTATDAVKRLEARLGVKLLLRTTRSVTPTCDGEAYYHRCLDILALNDETEEAFAGGMPKGQLRVAAHGLLVRQMLLPRLPGFLNRYPDLDLCLCEEGGAAELQNGGTECVLREGRVDEGEGASAGDMIHCALAVFERVTLASPGYLATYGRPQSCDLLAGHRAVGLWSAERSSVQPLEFASSDGVRQIALPYRVCVSSADSYLASARQGLGLIQIPRYHAETDIMAGRLVEILTDVPPPETRISLLYAGQHQLSPRLRVFVEWLETLFAQPL